MKIEVLKSKTVLASVAAVAVAGARVYLGDASGWDGLQTAVLALVAVFLRSAVGDVADKAAAGAAVGAEVGAAAGVAGAVSAARESPQGRAGPGAENAPAGADLIGAGIPEAGGG